jgi:hypothetical protein
MSFEIVVRPVVLPNIRPAPAQSLPPQDDPDKGFAIINGNGAKQINLTNSYSSSASSAQRTETKRRVDVARVYQKKDDGKVNKDNFVDIEVANKIWMKGGSEPSVPPSGDSFHSLAMRPTVGVEHYQRVKEEDNVEIKKRDQMRTNESDSGT